MMFFATLLAASVFAVWGAHRLGVQSPKATIWVSPVLVALAYALFSVEASQGEGAAAGVGIVWLGSWFIGGVSLLVALTMLGSAAWRHGFIPAKLLLLIIVPTATVLLVRRFGPSGGGRPNQPVSARSESGATRTAGYAWAVDNAILADSSCRGDTPEFVAGCRAGAARNRAAIRP